MKFIMFSIIMFSTLYSCVKRDISNNHYVDDLELIEKTIHTSIGWAIEKNINALFDVVAADSNYISIHPTNRVIIGTDQFKNQTDFWMSSDFKATGYEIRDLRINISNEGNVAWFFGFLNDYGEWKGQEICWENARWTGVLEKRKGKWEIVQMHFSFPQ